MASKDDHGIRPVKYTIPKVHIRIDCDNCHKWESVNTYEDKVGEREFNTTFWECEHCGKVICNVCHPKKEDLECPICEEDSSVKLKPIDIYVCNICLSEYTLNRFCNKCKYDRGKKWWEG